MKDIVTRYKRSEKIITRTFFKATGTVQGWRARGRSENKGFRARRRILAGMKDDENAPSSR